jgi:hypothetical protein
LGSGCRSSGPIDSIICEFRERNSAPEGGANGLGDLNPTFFLSPARPGKLIWGFGPTFLAPTATDPTLGQGKWGAGPSIVLLVQPEHWTIGVLANNIWSFAGNEGRTRVNQFLTQYFVTRNFEHGWFLTSAPILTANWRAPNDKSVACAVRRRLWENDEILRSADGPADACLLQRRPSKRPPVPEVASASASGAVIPGSKMRSSAVSSIQSRGFAGEV